MARRDQASVYRRGLPGEANRATWHRRGRHPGRDRSPFAPRAIRHRGKVRPVVRQPAGPRPEPPNSRLRLRRTSTGRCRNGFRRPVNHPSSFASRTERTHAIRCHVLRRFSRGRRGGDLPHHAGSRPAGGRRERKSAVGGTISGDHRFSEGELPEDLIEDLPDITYERHLHHGSLIGSPGSCGPVVERSAAAGVAEVAWLVDFGLTNDHLPAGIKPLFDPAELRQ